MAAVSNRLNPHRPGFAVLFADGPVRSRYSWRGEFRSRERPSLSGQLHQAVVARLNHGFSPFGSVANLFGEVEGDLRVTVAIDHFLPLEIVILSLVVLAAAQQG